MSIFSYGFFIFWSSTLVLYYTIGSKWQWQALLITSVIFYVMMTNAIPWILIIVWIITYQAGIIIEQDNNTSAITAYMVLFVCIIALFFGRMTSFFVTLGNSYFILKATGYLIDISRGKKAERDMFKFLLYLVYWPTILEGPFNRIDDFNNSFNAIIHFDYNNFTHGIQRFVWGVFKKIVVSERLGVLSTCILSDPKGKGGLFVISGVISFALQLYTDFSGFMDMMLGVSTTYGIKLPENFNQPFFSKSISEFWRRWHITLGMWFRDYLLFPFSSSTVVKSVSRRIKKRNKSIGKMFPIVVGTWLVWISTGLWHGFSKNYLLWGIYYAIIMSASYIMNTIINVQKKHESILLNCIRIIRTVLIVIVADTFICVSNLSSVIVLWKEILTNFFGGNLSTITNAGINKNDSIILFICIIVILIVSIINEKKESIQLLLDKSPTIIRWGFYYCIFFIIIIYGLYSDGYDVNQFMYMSF